MEAEKQNSRISLINWVFAFIATVLFFLLCYITLRRRCINTKCTQCWMLFSTRIAMLGYNGISVVYFAMRASDEFRNYLYASKMVCTIHGNIVHGITIVLMISYGAYAFADIFKNNPRYICSTFSTNCMLTVLIWCIPFLLNVCLSNHIDWYMFFPYATRGYCIRAFSNSKHVALFEHLVIVLPVVIIIMWPYIKSCICQSGVNKTPQEVLTKQQGESSQYMRQCEECVCEQRVHKGTKLVLQINLLWNGIFNLFSVYIFGYLYFDDLGTLLINLINSVLICSSLKKN